MRGRRLLALAVLLPLLEPAGVRLSVLASSRPHECTEHSCRCARHCPPRKALSDCHGAARTDAAMTGSCHRGEAPRLGAITPYVLPAPLETGPAWQDEPAASSAPSRILPGHSRLDIPPPRTS